MKFVYALVLIVYSAIGLAQSPYGPTNDSLYLGFYRDSIALLERPIILVTPFHPDQYMSEIDRYIAEGTNYTFQHTRGFFRKGLDNAIIIAAKEHNEYVNLHADDASLNHDLDFFYKVIAPSVKPYEPPVIKDDQNFKSRLANYWEKLQSNVEQTDEPGARIERGEVVSVADHRELITKAKVVNPILFDSLTPKYNVDYYISINELNLLNAAANQQAYESDNYDRVIIAHFTVFDSDGNELYSLIKKRYFSSLKNELTEIITDEILPLGYEVIYTLDSYRFLKAGLNPEKSPEEKKSAKITLPDLPPLRKN